MEPQRKVNFHVCVYFILGQIRSSWFWWCVFVVFFNCNYFKFQSLDYDNIENQLFLEEERRMSHMVSHNSWGKKRTAKRWCTLLLCSFLFLFISLVFTLFGVFRVFVVWRSVVGWSAVWLAFWPASSPVSLTSWWSSWPGSSTKWSKRVSWWFKIHKSASNDEPRPQLVHAPQFENHQVIIHQVSVRTEKHLICWWFFFFLPFSNNWLWNCLTSFYNFSHMMSASTDIP